jgi:hypothetical protein
VAVLHSVPRESLEQAGADLIVPGLADVPLDRLQMLLNSRNATGLSICNYMSFLCMYGAQASPK